MMNEEPVPEMEEAVEGAPEGDAAEDDQEEAPKEQKQEDTQQQEANPNMEVKQNSRHWSKKQVEEKSELRDDRTETCFFATALKTSGGKVKGSFYLSGLVTKFRITANSFGKNAVFGFNTASFVSTKAFYSEVAVPYQMVQGEKMQMITYLYNNNDFNIEVRMKTT